MSYWSWNSGRSNALQGLNGEIIALSDCFGRYLTQPDADNPAVLDGETILYVLRMSRDARNSFRRIFPTLTAGEQDRLTELLNVNPRLSALVADEQRFHDDLQSAWNKGIPVRTTGRRGGMGPGRAQRAKVPGVV